MKPHKYRELNKNEKKLITKLDSNMRNAIDTNNVGYAMVCMNDLMQFEMNLRFGMDPISPEWKNRMANNDKLQ